MSVINLSPALRDMFAGLDSRLRKLENSSVFQAPSTTVDPAVLRNGMIWYRSDLGTFRVYQAGAIRTITTT